KSIKDGVEETGNRKEIVCSDNIISQCSIVRQLIISTIDHKEFRGIHHKSIFDRLKTAYKAVKEKLLTIKNKNTEPKGDRTMKQNKIISLKDIREIYSGVDESHGFGHIKDVIKKTIKLTEYVEKVQGKSVNKAVVQNAAALHDVTSHTDRENHHASGARESRKILKSKGLALSSDELDRIEVCIYEHRASYTGELSSIESEILSSADRNAPREIHIAYERSYQYALEKGLATDFDGACKHAYEHIINKYAKGGYAKFPKLYQEFYAEDIKWMENEIATLTLKSLKEKLKYMR
ncbi:MAG: hypothetical protein ACRCXX_08680, partial [Cetobacterium sp.]|uniref:hypothetical protein n=1 Tax=Cetobacterium sp. TaxID=2071632 RepID=UPI003F370391